MLDNNDLKATSTPVNLAYISPTIRCKITNKLLHRSSVQIIVDGARCLGPPVESLSILRPEFLRARLVVVVYSLRLIVFLLRLVVSLLKGAR